MSTVLFLLKGAGVVIAMILLSGFAVATIILAVKWSLFLVRVTWDSLAKEFSRFAGWIADKLPKNKKE